MTTPTTTRTAADPRAQLPRGDRHRPKGGPVRRSRRSRWRALVLIAVYVLVGLHLLHWWGTGESLSPVEPSEAMHTLEHGVVNAGFLLFVGLILSTLVFGRWFCGWACHVVALQDLCAWLLARIGLRPRPVRSRLLVLVPFVVAGYMFVWPQVRIWLGLDARVWQPELQLTTERLWASFPGVVMSIATFAVVGFLIVWWLGAKGFCTYGCPYGAVFAPVERFATGRIRVTGACEHCGHCTAVCTSNVRVHEEVAKHGMVVDPGCMKCLDCVSVCPKHALYYGFGPIKPFATSQQRIRARADFTWGEELALALVTLLAFLAFRGAWFLEPVPLLLAVALGVITAVFALLGWRLLVMPDVTFQHAALAQGGRLRPAGRWAVAGIAAWLLLALHTGAIRFCVFAAEGHAAVAWSREAPDTERGAAFAGIVTWLDRAAAIELLTDPYLHAGLGLALRELGELPRAEAEFRRALAIAPTLPKAAVPLCDLLQLRGELDECERLLEAVLAAHPGHQPAVQRLELLRQRRGR